MAEHGINRDINMAYNYLDHIYDYININGLNNLDPSFVYNLAFAEYFNESSPNTVNMTRVI